MKLIKSKVEYLPQEPGIDGAYKQIELCGRTCYQSTPKDGKAEEFVDRMISNHHTAMLEHGTVYLHISNDAEDDDWVNGYAKNPYSKIIPYTDDGVNYWAVTTNYRVLVENDWLRDLKFGYWDEPTEHHERRYTFKFICSRAIANELVRHRVFSFAQESQRYCGYDKGKFNGEISFIIPSHIKMSEGEYGFDEFFVDELQGELSVFMYHLLDAEEEYMYLRESGWTPQQARDVLPNATKTELCMTGFASDWRHLLDLRLFQRTGCVHPDMLDLMQKLRAEAENAGIWDDIMKYPSKFE